MYPRITPPLFAILPIDGVIQDWQHWSPNTGGSSEFGPTRYTGDAVTVRPKPRPTSAFPASSASIFISFCDVPT